MLKHNSWLNLAEFPGSKPHESGVLRKGTQTVKRFRCIRFRLPVTYKSIFHKTAVAPCLAGAKSIFALADTIVSDGPSTISDRKKSSNLALGN